MRRSFAALRPAALMPLALACFVSLSSLPAATQRNSAGLRIVVIEGEDAINVIQQKTAVAPVIEVRDRNDQPVAGALVNFAIRSGRATFGGGRTLTMTTNAAGRAVAAGFTPTGSGTLQITATAAFQGETATAVTIAQTTVQTAAQAAAATSAGGAGGSSGGASAGAGAGAGGGGLSGTTLGIVGAAAAAGAVAAKQLGIIGGGQVYRGDFSGTLPRAVNSGASACVQDEQQTGTLEMSLDDNGGSISGKASVDGDIALSPGTCPPNQFNTGRDTFGLGSGPVTGTRERLTLTANRSNNYQDPNGTTGVNLYDFSFIGSFDGTQVTGALTITRIVTPTGSNFPSRGTITYNVTLR